MYAVFIPSFIIHPFIFSPKGSDPENKKIIALEKIIGQGCYNKGTYKSLDYVNIIYSHYAVFKGHYITCTESFLDNFNFFKYLS